MRLRGLCPALNIVRKVINTFIDTESLRRGRGIKFRYPVEDLSTGEQLFIYRPGGLNKWNFDFKVEVLEKFGVGKGTHKDIISDLKNKEKENPQKFVSLMESLTAIYKCLENDVDHLLEDRPSLQKSFQTGAKVDIILKIIKWMFIYGRHCLLEL